MEGLALPGLANVVIPSGGTFSFFTFTWEFLGVWDEADCQSPVVSQSFSASSFISDPKNPVFFQIRVCILSLKGRLPSQHSSAFFIGKDDFLHQCLHEISGGGIAREERHPSDKDDT